MAKNDQYSPDYKKLYPGIEIRPEILAVLKQSDRKMKYIDVELKTERFIHSQEKQTAVFLPSREDSYDRMCEDEHMQFASDGDLPEDEMLHNEKIQLLRAALLDLEPDEAALIRALFYEGLSERKYAKQLGISQKGVNKRRKKVLGKLRALLDKKK